MRRRLLTLSWVIRWTTWQSKLCFYSYPVLFYEPRECGKRWSAVFIVQELLNFRFEYSIPSHFTVATVKETIWLTGRQACVCMFSLLKLMNHSGPIRRYTLSSRILCDHPLLLSNSIPLAPILHQPQRRRKQASSDGDGRRTMVEKEHSSK